MHLSKREQILLGILIALVITVLPFILVLMPRIGAVTQSSIQLNTVKQQKQDAEEVINALSQNEKEIESLQAEARELYELMQQTKSYDISLILTNMMNLHNITPESLSIHPYEPAVKPGMKEGDTVEDEPDSTADTSGSDAEGGTSKVALMRTASLSFSGAPADVAGFLDDISNYNKSVVLSGFSASYGENAAYDATIYFYEFVEPKVQETEKTE